MLRLDQAIYRVLATNAGVTAIVGTRITAGVLPQTTTYPAIAYRLAGEDSIVSLDASNGLRSSTVRVFCCTKANYGAAASLAEAVRLAMADFKGSVSDGASPSSTVTIQGTFAAGLFEAYDDRTGTWQVIRDFDIWSHEEVPVH